MDSRVSHRETQSANQSEHSSPRQRVKYYVAGLSFIMVFCVGITMILALTEGSIANEYIVVGLLFGQCYGTTISLGLWASLGQGKYLIRMLLTLCAFGAITVALFLGILLSLGYYRFDYLFSIFIAGSMLAQLALTQVILVTVRMVYGLRVVKRESLLQDGSNFQFGIIHIMALTLMVAVLLAAGQGILATVKFESREMEGVAVFSFLSMLGILMALPLGLASLVAHRFVLAVLFALVGVTLIGVSAPMVLERLRLRDKPDQYHLMSINLATVLVVLIFTLGLRLLGYRLTFAMKNKRGLN